MRSRSGREDRERTVEDGWPRQVKDMSGAEERVRVEAKGGYVSVLDNGRLQGLGWTVDGKVQDERKNGADEGPRVVTYFTYYTIVVTCGRSECTRDAHDKGDARAQRFDVVAAALVSEPNARVILTPS